MRRSRAPRGKRRREHTKGPYGWKTSRAEEAPSFDDEVVEAVLAAPRCRGSTAVFGWWSAGVRRHAPLGSSGRGDRDVRGSIESSPWEDNAHAGRDGTPPVYAPTSIRRSGHGGVNHRLLRKQLHGAQGSRGSSARREAMQRPEAHEVRVSVWQFGWQRLVGIRPVGSRLARKHETRA